jgi:hypothetical protein
MTARQRTNVEAAVADLELRAQMGDLEQKLAGFKQLPKA